MPRVRLVFRKALTAISSCSQCVQGFPSPDLPPSLASLGTVAAAVLISGSVPREKRRPEKKAMSGDKQSIDTGLMARDGGLSGINAVLGLW